LEKLNQRTKITSDRLLARSNQPDGTNNDFIGHDPGNYTSPEDWTDEGGMVEYYVGNGRTVLLPAGRVTITMAQDMTLVQISRPNPDLPYGDYFSTGILYIAPEARMALGVKQIIQSDIELVAGGIATPEAPMVGIPILVKAGYKHYKGVMNLKKGSEGIPLIDVTHDNRNSALFRFEN